MNRVTNLISIVDAYDKLTKGLRDKYVKFFNAKLKEHEFEDLKTLVNILRINTQEFNDFENYYLGYEIPQIGIEFDILRFGKDDIINIELKSKFTTEEKIKIQLERSNHYLSFLNKKIKAYTFISDTKELWTIDEDEQLIKVEFELLLQDIINQKIELVEDINTLFDPSNYLISPFNSTKDFIKGEYFLNNQQLEFKNEIIKKIENNELRFFSITGKAGTGKTILTYDIAKYFIDKDLKVLIIHCAPLNQGQNKLRRKYEWCIVQAGSYDVATLNNYDLVIIDETQRMWNDQLNSLIEEVKDSSVKCIFSYDQIQCLSKKAVKSHNSESIKSRLNSKEYSLTHKIRTNPEIADFIKALFDKSKPNLKGASTNIDIKYFDSYELARDYLDSLDIEWKLINYTPLKYSTPFYEKYGLPGEDCVHEVIGQEFEKVVGIIDEYFIYNGSKLTTRYNDRVYIISNMLHQIVTRTRKKLLVIIINNPPMLERCLKILNIS